MDFCKTYFQEKKIYMDFKLLYLFYLDFKNDFKKDFQTSMHFIKLIHSVRSDPPQPIFFQDLTVSC